MGVALHTHAHSERYPVLWGFVKCKRKINWAVHRTLMHTQSAIRYCGACQVQTQDQLGGAPVESVNVRLSPFKSV